MKEVTGTVGNFRGEMKGDVQNLETKMTDGFRNEGILRKKDYDDLKAKMRRGFEKEATKKEGGFKNEENERRKVYEELTKMKGEKTMKMGSSCTVSSAARTGYGLGSGTITTSWTEMEGETLGPRKIEVKGW